MTCEQWHIGKFVAGSKLNLTEHRCNGLLELHLFSIILSFFADTISIRFYFHIGNKKGHVWLHAWPIKWLLILFDLSGLMITPRHPLRHDSTWIGFWTTPILYMDQWCISWFVFFLHAGKQSTDMESLRLSESYTIINDYVCWTDSTSNLYIYSHTLN